MATKTQHAVIIPADSTKLMSVDFKFEQTLENLQKAVGGYIEVVRLSPMQIKFTENVCEPLAKLAGGKLNLKGAVLVCDEEGTLKENPVLNLVASELTGRPIVGDVVITVVD